MPKVTKKLERLARAFAFKNYAANGMLAAKGAEYVCELVEERWPMFLDDAETLNQYMLMVEDWELVGQYKESQRPVDEEYDDADC